MRHLEAAVDALARLGTPETPFDYVAPGVSGPVVILKGFTDNEALKKEAEDTVKNLKWVVHVVNEIDYLEMGPELRSQRGQALGILEQMIPQAFPENHANIRIKVTRESDITVAGVISPADKTRLEAVPLEEAFHRHSSRTARMWARSASARVSALGLVEAVTAAASSKPGGLASVDPLVMTRARSTTFSSSRTLPGRE